jgi:hypothetical protein
MYFSTANTPCHYNQKKYTAAIMLDLIAANSKKTGKIWHMNDLLAVNASLPLRVNP